jgi:heme exporter protein CcmD
MIFDLKNPQAWYVVAAYAVAACGLLGLWVLSLRDYRRRRHDVQRLKNKDGV